MPDVTRRLVVLALALALAGCTGRVETEEREIPTTAVPTEVTGVITDITTGADRSDVTRFVLESRTEDASYELLIDPEIDYGFDLAHLFEHQDTGDPVLVEVDERPGGLYALRVDDA